jgi:hypothetical protein
MVPFTENRPFIIGTTDSIEICFVSFVNFVMKRIPLLFSLVRLTLCVPVSVYPRNWQRQWDMELSSRGLSSEMGIIGARMSQHTDLPIASSRKKYMRARKRKGRTYRGRRANQKKEDECGHQAKVNFGGIGGGVYFSSSCGVVLRWTRVAC